MLTALFPSALLFRNSAQLITVSPITPPTLMLMPPPIMTIVSAQEMMISAALSLIRSKIICGLRKPPLSVSMAAMYMAAKMPILMYISIWVSLSGSLT